MSDVVGGIPPGAITEVRQGLLVARVRMGLWVVLAGVLGFAAAAPWLESITTYESIAVVAVLVGAAIVADELNRQRRTTAASQEALRRSEADLRGIFEHMRDVFYRTSLEGTLEIISPSIEKYGYSPAELIGSRTLALYAHESERNAMLAALLSEGEVHDIEINLRLKDGTTVPVSATARLVCDTNGHPIATEGILRDIGERKRQEERVAALIGVARDIRGTLNRAEILDRVQRRTAAALECERVGTLYWDPTSNLFRELSQYGVPAHLEAAAAALEFPPGTAVGDQLMRGHAIVLNDIADQSLIPIEVLQYFEVMALAAAPLRVRGRPLGALMAISTTPGRVFDAAKVELLEGIAQQLALALEAVEVYDAQREEAEVASALARVGRDLLTASTTPFLLDRLCQLTTEVLQCEFSRTFLWQPHEGVYAPVATHGDSDEEWEALRAMRVPRGVVAELAAALEREEVVQVGTRVNSALLPAGLQVAHGISLGLFIALRRGDEIVGIQTAGYRGSNKPFTSVQERIARGLAQVAALAIEEARLVEEVERANRAKADFVATISHELRTPLGIILGYSDLLHDGTLGSLNTEQAEIVERLSLRSHELLDLVNAALDISRLDSGQAQVNLEHVDVRRLLDQIAASTARTDQNREVLLQWEIAADLPDLSTDLLKLKVVLNNLISNALKFTAQGRVTVAAVTRNGGVEFRVSDTGIGIEPDAQVAIFDAFHQAHSSIGARYGGAGLGLHIVRRLLDLLGGTITVDSEVGRGSTFRVWIPSAVGTPPTLDES